MCYRYESFPLNPIGSTRTLHKALFTCSESSSSPEFTLFLTPRIFFSFSQICHWLFHRFALNYVPDFFFEFFGARKRARHKPLRHQQQTTPWYGSLADARAYRESTFAKIAPKMRIVKKFSPATRLRSRGKIHTPPSLT